jgi:chromosome partitioning protein
MVAAIVTVAQQKGGAGKTTLVVQLATALAADGRHVALVDIDPQGSLTAWMRRREHRSPQPPAELRFSMIGGWRLSVELDRLKREADLILVDTPPHAQSDAKGAVRAADLVLIPCQPSPLDVWASAATIDLARKERSPAVMVLNRVPPRGRSLDEATTAMRELGAPALEARLGNRQAFVASIGQGLGVVESEPKSAAAEEAQALAREIADNAAPVSVALARRMMWTMLGEDHPMKAHRADSRAMFARGQSDDAREGVTSFLEKRPARFGDRVSDGLPEIFPGREPPAFE